MSPPRRHSPFLLASALGLLLPLAACDNEQSDNGVVTDACLPNPCLDGDRTVCTVIDAQAVCSCREGFVDTAGTCVRPGPCEGDPCTQPNRSVCLESGETAVCLCDEGFRDYGDGQCVPVSSCTPNPCTRPNRTVCEESDGLVTCSCIPGTRDDGAGGCVSENPCASEPCTQPNRSVCLAQGLTAVCLCDEGYVDDGNGICVKASGCDPNPCQQANRSVCTDSGETFVCSCDPGFREETGDRCVPLDACSPNPCLQNNRNACTNIGGTAVCACNEGFEDRASICVPSDPCNPNPCTTIGQTICDNDGNGSWSCLCSPGYRPAGQGCEPVPAPTCANQHTTGDAYEPNECPTLATEIITSTPQSHTINPVGDVDWVRFSVSEPTVIAIEETGPFATRVSLYGPDGVTPLVSNAADRIVYKLPAAGTWYAEFRAATPSQTGNTAYLFTNLGPDDHGDTNATATPVSLGALTGRFDFPGDWDVLAVPVQAGRIYVFEETSAADVLLSLTSSDATLVATRDAPEAIRFRAATTETLYFAVRLASSSATGTWAITLADVGADDHADGREGASLLAPAAAPGAVLDGQFDYPQDWDCVAVPVVQGRIYSFAEESSFDVYFMVLRPADTFVSSRDAPENHMFKAQASENLTLCVRPYSSSAIGAWRLRVTDLGLDDHADNRDGANTAQPSPDPGTAVDGSFEYWGDMDCVGVPVVANRIYHFGEENAVDVMFSILSPTATLIASRDYPEMHVFKAQASEVLTICIRPYSNSQTGAWRLRIIDLGLDDHADDRTGANSAQATTDPGTAVDGSFQFWGDTDCVAVPVVAGRVYHFGEESAIDVMFSILLPTATLIASRDYPEMYVFKAQASETLTICIRPYSSSQNGAWRLRIIDLGLDDHADGRAGATVVQPLSNPGAVIDGSFEYWSDMDCVAVPVVADRIYRFEEESTFDVMFSILTPTDTLIPSRDAPENHTFKAATTQNLTVCIRPYNSSRTGAWRLRLTDLGLDDHADTRANASALTIGAAATNGNIQFIGDLDFFSFVVDGSAQAFSVVTTGIQTAIQVQNAAGDVVRSGNGPNTLTFSVPSQGTYFIRIVGNATTTLGAYTVRVQN